MKNAATHAASVSNVSKVLVAESSDCAHLPAEEISNLLVHLSKSFTHVLAPSSNNGKNFLPRAAAVLDSSPLSDVISVESSEIFKRPMYAGNAIATVKMTNPIKVSRLSFIFHTSFVNFAYIHVNMYVCFEINLCTA